MASKPKTISPLVTPNDFLRGMQRLAASPAAKILVSEAPAASAIRKAATDYIAAAQASGLPPDLWRVERRVGVRHVYLVAPLAYFWQSGSGQPRADALLALAQGGCSPWSVGPSLTPSGATIEDGGSYRLNPGQLTRFLAAGDSPTRRAYLKIILADSLTPERFAQELVTLYQSAVSQSSPTAKGVLGPADKAAKAFSSLLVACETEILASTIPGAASLKTIARDAKKRLAVKQEAPLIADPEALKKSLSPEQKARLSLLILILRQQPKDAQIIEACLEATPWIKGNPDLACVALPKGSLLAQALEAGSPAALSWLEKAGSNMWLASAQAGQANACLWAAFNLHNLPDGEDLSPIARMLLRGAWLDGRPDPKESCVRLATSAVEALRKSYKHSPQLAERARELLAAIERATLDEITQAAPSSPTAKPARRSAL